MEELRSCRGAKLAVRRGVAKMRQRVFLRSWRRAFFNVRRFYNMYAFTCIALKNLVQKNCLAQWKKDVARKKRKRYANEHPVM